MPIQRLVLILATALLAALLGLIASVALYGPGPLLHTELGQRLLQRFWAEPLPSGLRIIEIGEPVPAFDLPRLQGSISRVPVPQRPTLINYWASWCGPCREEMPILAAFAKQQSDTGVQVIGIALDEPRQALAFLREQPTDLPILLESASDRDSSLTLGNRAGVLPYTVLIGADGRLLKRQLGAFADLDKLHDWAATAP